MPRPLARPVQRTGHRPVDVPVAVAAWVVAFFVGQTMSMIVLIAAGDRDADLAPIPTVFLAVAASWVAYLAGAWWASTQSGTGSMVRDYAIEARPADLVGVPIGVGTQLVLVPLLYDGLVRVFPGTFTEEQVTENAERLVGRADGVGVFLLVVMVCVGAPLVEEIVYRGMLQGALATRLDDRWSMVIVAVWFTLIHFRPVEYPGLVVFALVVGALRMWSGRLGPSIVTHIAFNAAGLVLAW
ncbi:MAG: lysostaphin resistance A-like protein [Desertimonas sp.]